MRLSFPNKEHEDTLIGAGDTLIGAAPDNTIVLDRSGISPHHLKLSVNDHGIVLTVTDAQARTHVNTRPVREKAMLRLGDVVSLDTLQFVLKPDRDDIIRTDLPSPQSFTPPPPSEVSVAQPRMVPPRALLRGLSGARFGKIVPIRGKLVIGRDAQSDLALDEPEMAPRHAVIELTEVGILLRDVASINGTLVNGVRVKNAILHAGDQIAFERNRFVLEAPGLPDRPDTVTPVAVRGAPNITQTMKAIQLPDEDDAMPDPAPAERANKNDIWWLIVAAALIAAGLALLFLVRI